MQIDSMISSRIRFVHEIPPLFKHEGAIHISNQVTLNPRLQVSFEATSLLPICNVGSKESNEDKFKASLMCIKAYVSSP